MENPLYQQERTKLIQRKNFLLTRLKVLSDTVLDTSTELANVTSRIGVLEHAMGIAKITEVTPESDQQDQELEQEDLDPETSTDRTETHAERSGTEEPEKGKFHDDN